MKFWVNTLEEYNKLGENVDENTLYFITDDEEDCGNLTEEFVEHKDNLSIHTPALTADKTIYVSPTGSDESGDGSKAKPYRTPQFAVDSIPTNLIGFKLTINLALGDYGRLDINNFYGGTVWIDVSENVVINGAIIVDNSNVHLHAPNLIINSNTDAGLWVTNGGDLGITTESSITINSTPNFKGILAESGVIHSGIYGGMRGKITVNNTYHAISALYSGIIQLDHVFAGTGNHYGLFAFGGIIQFKESIMPAVIPIYEAAGGRVFSSQNANQSGTWTPKLRTLVNGVMTDIPFTITRAKWSKIANRYFINLALTINDLRNIKNGLYIANLPAICNVPATSTKTDITFLKEDYRHMLIKSGVRASEQHMVIWVTDNTTNGIGLYDAHINVAASLHDLFVEIDYEAV